MSFAGFPRPIDGIGKIKNGNSDLSNGTVIPITNLLESTFPKHKTSLSSLYAPTSNGLSMDYDNLSDTIIGTSYNSNTSAQVARFVPSTLSLISSLPNVSSDFSGNNPSTFLSNIIAYIASGTPRYYINYFTYQNGTSGTTSIRVVDATTGALITIINSTGADVIIKKTSTYVIYFSAYYSKFHKLDFTTNTVTVLADLSTLYGANATSPGNIILPKNANFFYYVIGSNTHCYSTDGVFQYTISGYTMNVTAAYMYHDISDCLIRINYVYGPSGGHYYERINKVTGATISSTRMSTYNNVSAGALSSIFYDKTYKFWLCSIGSANANYFTFCFKIKDDGTLDKWNFGSNNNWIESLEGATTTPTMNSSSRCGDGSRAFVLRYVSNYTYFIDSYNTKLTIAK